MCQRTIGRSPHGERDCVRYRTPDKRQTSKRGFRTKHDAEQFLASVEVSMGRGEWVDPTLPRVSVSAWADVWIAAHANLKPSTRSAYEWQLTRHVLPKWGTTPLVAASHTNVRAWVTKLSETLAPSSALISSLDVAEAVTEPEGDIIRGTPKNHERRSVLPGVNPAAPTKAKPSKATTSA